MEMASDGTPQVCLKTSILQTIIVLVSSKYEHIQNDTNRLVDNVGRVGLKLNAQKCKATRMEDIKKRLRKAQGEFSNLMKIWNTRSIGRNTKN